jgi:hypothetical protein
MSEPNWFDIFLAGVSAIMGWLLKRYVSRLDEVRENYVTREQLDAAIQQNRQDRYEMHRQNTEALNYIRGRLDSFMDRK